MDEILFWMGNINVVLSTLNLKANIIIKHCFRKNDFEQGQIIKRQRKIL